MSLILLFEMKSMFSSLHAEFNLRLSNECRDYDVKTGQIVMQFVSGTGDIHN